MPKNSRLAGKAAVLSRPDPGALSCSHSVYSWAAMPSERRWGLVSLFAIMFSKLWLRPLRMSAVAFHDLHSRPFTYSTNVQVPIVHTAQKLLTLQVCAALSAHFCNALALSSSPPHTSCLPLSLQHRLRQFALCLYIKSLF